MGGYFLKNLTSIIFYIYFFQKKVEKYWPDINEEITFGDVKVKYVLTEVHANFHYRKFNVYCGKSERKVKHCI